MIRAAIDRSSGVLVLVSPAGRTDQSHGAALPRATRALAARQRRTVAAPAAAGATRTRVGARRLPWRGRPQRVAGHDRLAAGRGAGLWRSAGRQRAGHRRSVQSSQPEPGAMPVSRRATGTGGARGARGALDHGDAAVCRVPGPRAAPEKRNGCRADADGAADLQARDAYLAYRRDGGERDTHGGKWAAEIAHLLLDRLAAAGR